MTGAEVTRTGDMLRLALTQVTRGMAGELTCSADNGFQDTPVTKSVKVWESLITTCFLLNGSRSMLSILLPLKYPRPSLLQIWQKNRFVDDSFDF